MKVLTLLVVGAAFAGCTPEWEAYTQVKREGPKPVEGLVNAEFEDSKAYGPMKVGYKAEIGRYGYNGGGGARYWPRHDTRIFHFPFTGKLENGRTYHFSCMFKPHGRMWPCINLTRYRNGKYLHEYGGSTRHDVGDGWIRNDLVFTLSPKDGERGLVERLGVWVRPDEKDPKVWQSDDYYIDIDSVHIEEAVPLWRFCNVWPIQNRVYAETGRIRCHNQFVGAFFESNAVPFFVSRLNTKDGVSLGERVSAADADGVFTVDFGPLDYTGEAELVVALYDRAHRLGYGEQRVAVTVIPTPTPARGKPFIAENGATYVDGKPFMPLGFWTGLADHCLTNKTMFVNYLRDLRDAGFNAIVEYGGYRLFGKDREFFYDQCDKYGIHVFAGELGLGRWDECGKKKDRPAAYRELAAHYAKYPAVFTWFVTDECGAERVPDLIQMRRNLSMVAPDIPMWPCNIFDPEPFLPGQDVQGGDLYPYRNPGSTLAGSDQKLAAFEACRPAACWHSPQCYNWYHRGWTMKPEDYLKGEPDENQMLAVAVLMASRSVTGFLFYSHFFMWRPCVVPGQSEVRWARMKEIAKKMNDLAPFVTSGIRREEVSHVDRGDPCRVVKMSDGKGNSRLLVIGLGLKHECEIDLSAIRGLKGESVCGKTTIANGKAVYRAAATSCDIIR